MLRLYKSTKRDLLILFSELDEMMTSLLRKQQIKIFKTFRQRISKMEKKKINQGKKIRVSCSVILKSLVYGVFVFMLLCPPSEGAFRFGETF